MAACTQQATISRMQLDQVAKEPSKLGELSFYHELLQDGRFYQPLCGQWVFHAHGSRQGSLCKIC